MDLQKRLYVDNYAEWEYYSQRKCFSDEILKVRTVPDGIILPPREIPDPCLDPVYEGGVLDENLHFVAGSIRISESNPGYFAVIRGYTVNSEMISHSHENVIYGGVALAHFGLFLIECMSRLWYVLQHPEDTRRIVFIANGKIGSWMEEFLALLGIAKERYTIIHQPTQFTSIDVPEESVHSWGTFFTKEYRQIYACLRDKVKASPHKKIYLTHSSFKGQIVCCNEKYFEDYFAAKGFLVVSPEKYSLAEQIALMKGAEEVACMVSTLSHWILLSEPHTRLIMLARNNHEVLICQCLINEAAQADWYIVDASQNFLYGERNRGAILLGPNKHWRRFVRDYYGEDDANDTLPDEAFAYMQSWCRYYANDVHLRRLDSMDFVKLFRQMYEVVMGKECPPGLPQRSPKDEYMEELGHKLGSEQNYNEVLNELAGKPVLVSYEITTDGYKSLRCYSGQVCGTGNSPIRDIRISFTDEKVSCTYKLYLKGQGWTAPRKSGEAAELPGGHVYGLSIDLDSSCKSVYDLSFHLHTREGWSPALSDGTSASQESCPLDAIRIVIKRKASE